MSRRDLPGRLVSILVLSAGVSIAMYTDACAPADETTSSTTGTTGEPQGIDDVLYEGGASDEGLMALLAKEPVADPAQGTVFDEPKPGASLPGGAAPTFAWHVGGAGSDLRVPIDRPFEPRGVGIKNAPAQIRGGLRGIERARHVLREVVGGPRVAIAHGPPVNGRAYFLVFKGAGGETLVRVFTTLLSYTPDAAVWEKLHSSGGTITASIVGAIFENNRVAPDGGPFTGQSVTFSVQP